ncbi:Heat-labile enterotoxin, A chain [Metarhizium guizhouense ARSEF 977]|uniref:Heat-labile enterotoxin, A chain n=1 Tax=Metarhizium guizhouense (strain ARSEF 977) TaxID=1276136 RepID=A0A0B4G3A8_METGA|nr:Heat-labile enterotoxin, A chain [Metarhizium guizhouense ARSEF 977]
MRLKYFLAVLGFAVMAAGYSLPGAYERMLYYNAYKLDKMAGGSKIASGCSKSGICNFDDFIHFIEGRKPGKVVAITPNEFPAIKQTAQRLQDLGKTGPVLVGRIMNDAQSYPDLLKKLGQRLEGLLTKSSGFEHKTLKGAELDKEVANIKSNIIESMKRVFDARFRATIDSFRPYEIFKVVIADGGKGIDFTATVEANEGSITEQKLQEIWEGYVKERPVTEALVKEFKPLADYKPVIQEKASGFVDLDATFSESLKDISGMTKKWLRGRYKENIAGNHQENLRELEGAIQKIEPLVCGPSGGAKREVGGFLAKRMMTPCGPWDVPELDEYLKGTTTPKQALRAQRANSVSLQEFEASVVQGEHKVPKTWAEKGIKTLKDARTKLVGHQPFELSSPRLRPGNGGRATTGGLGKAASFAGAALWVKDVTQAFVENMTALDRAATLTSIIPFVGCVLSTAAAVQNNVNTGLIVLDAVLCNIADALLLGPLAPFGFILHLARAVIHFFIGPPGPPTMEEIIEGRNTAWDKFLADCFSYIYSHEFSYPDQSFASKLESAFAIDAVAVLTDAADRIGALNASSSADLYDADADPEMDLEDLEMGSQEAIGKIRAERGNVIARRQRQYLLGILDEFVNGTAFSLTAAASEASSQFIELINSEEFIKKYRNPEGTIVIKQGYIDGGHKTDRYSIMRKTVKKTTKHLQSRPLPLPQTLDVAFVLGQSKGMKFAQRDTLSLYSFFNVEITEALTEPTDPLFRYWVLVRHTLQLIKLIQGRIKENELDGSFFPVEDAELLRRFRLLIAMRLGKLYEDVKVEALDERSRSSRFILSPTAPPIIINPYIPPIPEHPNNALLVSLALGLTTAVNDYVFSKEVTECLEKETFTIRAKNLRAIQQQFQKVQQVIKKLPKKIYASPTTPSQLLENHKPACVELGPSAEECTTIIEGCYSADNTTDEFVGNCIRSVVLPPESARKRIAVQYRELCNTFQSMQACGYALANCIKIHTGSRWEVLAECAAPAAHVNATATPPTTS